MQSQFIYDSPENHVEQRPGISPILRAALFDVPREAWASMPQFRGEAEHWTHVHHNLLNASATLPDWIRQLQQTDDPAAMGILAPRIAGLGRQLVHHAHTHHHIEDHYFFPHFLALFPQLEHSLEMLDGDHKVLAEVLEGLEAAAGAFPVRPEGSDTAMRHAWLAGAERLLLAAERLDVLFIRHIGDEEEICIPAMLQL